MNCNSTKWPLILKYVVCKQDLRKRNVVGIVHNFLFCSYFHCVYLFSLAEAFY